MIHKITYMLLGLLLLSATAMAGTNAETKEYDINGLKVLVKPSPKQVISARLFLKGGTANYSEEKQGIERLTLTLMMTGGTKSLDKVAFNSKAESIGASFSADANHDFGNVSMTCIKSYWDESWALFTDAIMNPAFDPKEFKLLQEQLITAVKAEESEPDAYIKDLSMQFAFEGSNNAKVPNGTVESLSAITLEDVKNYYKDVVVREKAFLVIVGNISEEQLIGNLKQTLAKMPEGKPAKTEPRKLITDSGILIENRNIATNYIRGLMSAPRIDEEDGIAMKLAMAIMYDRYFLELRTNRSLSYAPAAFYSSGVFGNPYNVLYISTTKPKEALKVMVDLVNDVKANGFTADELKNKKQKFLTNYYMGLETSASQSYTLGTNYLMGDYKMMDAFNDKVAETTLRDINKAFDKYTKAIKWVYLGVADQVTEEDFPQTKEAPNKPY